MDRPVGSGYHRLRTSVGPRIARVGRILLVLHALTLFSTFGCCLLRAQVPTSTPQAHRPGGVLRGTVTATPDPRPRPLSGVEVVVPGWSGALGVVSDREGGYRIEGVPAGPVLVSFERVGYRPLVVEVRVPAGDTTNLDVQLAVDPVAVRGLVVTAVPPPTPLPAADVGSERRGRAVDVELRALETGPGMAAAGMVDAVRTLQGDGASDPAGALLMRGSTTDQKLFLLDGSPLYAPFHVGGLLRPFDVDLLASATPFVGGAPARYDGGLSYVLDLATRPGRRDALHGSAFLDLLGGGGTVEGPLGEGLTFLASGRALHELGQPLLGGGRSPFGYGEALLRGDLALGPDQRVSVTGFWNREAVRLDLPLVAGSAVEGRDAGTVGSATGIGPREATWGNEALSVGYEGGWSRTRVRTTLAASRYSAGLPLGGEDPAWAGARTIWARAASELTRTAGPWRLGVGLSAERIDHASRAGTLVDGLPTEAGGRSRSDALALYVEAARALGTTFDVRGALRLDHFPGSGGLHVAPRAALTWGLSDAADLTLSAGRYYQLPRGVEPEVGAALRDPGGLTAGHALFEPAQATHVVLSLDQRIDSDLRLSLDGFVKGFRNLPGTGTDVLRSSGVDLSVQRSGDELTGWVGYSLSWFWRAGEDGVPGDGATAGSSAEVGDFAGRHLLTVGLDGEVGAGWGARLEVSYGDGLPYASIPLLTPDGDLDGGEAPVVQSVINQTHGTGSPVESRIPTLDGFLRVDLEVSREWAFTWHGRGGTLRPYLRVLNALSRRDALFRYFEPWRSPEIRNLAERPLLPLAGAELRF